MSREYAEKVCSNMNLHGNMIELRFSSPRRFVQDRLNEKATLGNHLSIDGYLAERLNLNDEELQKMLKQCPRLRSRNVIQV